jgi:protein phosphatase PTC7
LIQEHFESYEDELLSKKRLMYPITRAKLIETIIKSTIAESVKKNNQLGSSTVSLIYLDKLNKYIYSAYLGDSCYLILRPDSVGDFRILFKAEEQTHSFNFPYQVGVDGDNPNKAIFNEHKVEKNDLIILATDGLWDNIETEDIVKEVNRLSIKNNSLNLDTESIAKLLSENAEEFSRDKNYYSPFAKRAKQNRYKNYLGGKPDDITVIIAQIIDDKDETNSKSILEEYNTTLTTSTTDITKNGVNL